MAERRGRRGHAGPWKNVSTLGLLLCLLSAALASQSAVEAPARVPDSVRLATFNVQNFFNGVSGDFSHSRGARDVRSLQRQQEKLAATIVALQPDILLLQEIENDFAPGAVGEPAYRGLLAAINTGRWCMRVVESDAGDDAIANLFFVSCALQQANRVGSLPSLTLPDIGRKAVGLVLDDTLQIVNVHLKSRARCSDASGVCQPARAAQARALAATVARSGQVIIGGDFNQEADAAEFAPLRALGLQPMPQSPASSYRHRQARELIDYFWLSPTLAAQVMSAGVWQVNSSVRRPCTPRIACEPGPVGSSDHDPVYLDLRWTAR